MLPKNVSTEFKQAPEFIGFPKMNSKFKEMSQIFLTTWGVLPPKFGYGIKKEIARILSR